MATPPTPMIAVRISVMVLSYTDTIMRIISNNNIDSFDAKMIL